MDLERVTTLSQQLAAAGAAHGEYEMTALHGEYDQQWAEWYANYLLAHDWNDIFPEAWNAASLADALRQADTAHRANAPQQKWQDYYAEFFTRA